MLRFLTCTLLMWSLLISVTCCSGQGKSVSLKENEVTPLHSQDIDFSMTVQSSTLNEDQMAEVNRVIGDDEFWANVNRADGAWGHLLDNFYNEGPENLTPAELLWVHVGTLIGLVNNGGLMGYYCNSGANHLPELMAGLEFLEASEVLELVEDFNQFFPEGISRSMDERNKVIRSWPDSVEFNAEIDRIENAIMPLMNDLETKLRRFLLSNGVVP